ncbi:MAG: TIGR03936 family radical SAM-associated protein [Phycisphaerae bacterium]|nr:TIGR03936 family radical SAM-associated protein [Phycisphaerae bacterium]
MVQGLSQDNSRIGSLVDIVADLPPSGRGREDQVMAVVELCIHGLAGYLSHSDLMRVAQRVCVRSGVDLVYSEGFNPHPRLSMPLPKSVGLVSDGDVVVMRVQKTDSPNQAWDIAETLRGQWPEGIEVRSVFLLDAGYTLYPHQAAYAMGLPNQEILETVHAKVDEFLAQTNLMITRHNWKKKYKTKQLDIRSYIDAIIKTTEGIVVTCRIREDGAIRVEEMLEALGVTSEDLEGPIQRTRLVWRLN